MGTYKTMSRNNDNTSPQKSNIIEQLKTSLTLPEITTENKNNSNNDDIYTDRKGFEELEPPINHPPKQIHHLSNHPQTTIVHSPSNSNGTATTSSSSSLIPSTSTSKLLLSSISLSKLPAVNERLSEETLDDCHAFNVVVVTRCKNVSNKNLLSTTNNDSMLLETLDEE